MIRSLFLCCVFLFLLVPVSFGAGSKLIAEGESLFNARGCSGCHGLEGRSERGEFPKLSGMPPEYITQSINYYKKAKRKDRAFREMKSKVRRLKPPEIEAIAAYLASQK